MASSAPRTAKTASPDIKAPAGALMSSEMPTLITMSGPRFRVDTVLARLIYQPWSFIVVYSWCALFVVTGLLLSNARRVDVERILISMVRFAVSPFPASQSYNKKQREAYSLQRRITQRKVPTSVCHQIKVATPKDKAQPTSRFIYSYMLIQFSRSSTLTLHF